MSDNVYRQIPRYSEAEEIVEKAYDPQQSLRQHQIGRTPPPAQQVEELHFDLKLDGQVIGVVYPMRLTGAAQLDLEDARSTRQVIAWLKTYAGADDETLAFVEHTLRTGPLGGINGFVRTVADALSRAVELSKPSGPR